MLELFGARSIMVVHEYARARAEGPRHKACVVLSISLTISSQGSQRISCLVLGRSWFGVGTDEPVSNDRGARLEWY